LPPNPKEFIGSSGDVDDTIPEGGIFEINCYFVSLLVEI
jgi:hypothetical protein